MVEEEHGVRMSMRVGIDRMPDDLIAAIRIVARAARLLPEADPPGIGSGTEPAFDAMLSDRERQVVLRIAEGKANKIIARELGIAEATVKIHMRAIMRKMGAANRTQVALWVTQRPPRPGMGKPGDHQVAGR